MQYLVARCEGLCALPLALHDGGRLRRLPWRGSGVGRIAETRSRYAALHSLSNTGDVSDDEVRCAHRLSPLRYLAPSRRARRSAHRPSQVSGRSKVCAPTHRLRGWGCAAGRSLWRREAQSRGRHAQRASSTCSPQLFERRARSAQRYCRLCQAECMAGSNGLPVSKIA